MMTYDAMVYQDGSYACAKMGEETLVQKRIGVDDAEIVKAAVEAVPPNGSIFIGAGTYDLEANNEFALNPDGSNPFWCCIPVLEGKNIHIQGAGIGASILRLKPGQHYEEHPVAMILSRAAGPLKPGFNAFTISDMTLDGNRDSQKKWYKDGASLILTGSTRSGGRYQNLELINSFGSGLYLGNNGSGPESKAIVQNIAARNCESEGLILDTANRSIVSNCIFESCKAGLKIYGNDDYLSREKDGLVVSNITSDSPIEVWYVNDLLMSNVNMDVSKCQNAYGLVIHDSIVHINNSKFVSDREKPSSLGGASYITGKSMAWLNSCYFDGFYALHALGEAWVSAQNCFLAASGACIYEKDLEEVKCTVRIASSFYQPGHHARTKEFAKGASLREYNCVNLNKKTKIGDDE